MRGFSAIIQALVLAMLDPRSNLGFCGGVRPKLVCDEYTRLTPAPKQLEKEPLGRFLVSARLNKDIKHIAIWIHHAPKPVFLALYRDHHFVQVPFVSRLGSIPACFGSKLPAETCYPIPHRFVGNLDPSRSKKILHIA